MCKQVLILSIGVWLLVSLASQSNAENVELIDLNDTNRNELPLEVSKALEIVQSALANGYKFETVSEASKFVEKCKDLSEYVSELDDQEFNGLAGKMKTLIRESELAELCKIKLSKLNKYEVLDESIDDAYLSRKTLSSIIALGKNLNEHPKIKRILGHLFEVVTTAMGERMMANAAYDTSVLFGELDQNAGFLKYDYLSACAISLLKPICKLIRRTNSEEATAIDADVADFTKALASHDQDTISHHEKASGVSINELKDTCTSIQKYIYPMQQVARYVHANFVNEQQVKEQSQLDKNFSFYYQLELLCQTQAGPVNK